MDFSSILYVGLGAGLGTALGTLFAIGLARILNLGTTSPRQSNLSSALFAGLSVIGMSFGSIGAKSLYNNNKLPRLFAVNYEDAWEDVAYMQAMKEYEPEHYAQFLTRVDELTRNGASYEEAVNAGREISIKIFSEKMPFANTDLLTRYYTISRDTFSAYKKTSPEWCAKILNGEPLGDVSTLLPTEIQEREAAALIDVIKLARTSPAPIDNAMAKMSQANIGQKIQSTLDVSAGLKPPADAPIEVYQNICDIGYMFFDEALKLSDEERSNFLRHLLSL